MTIDLTRRRTELLELRQRLLVARHELEAGEEGDGEMTSSAGDQHLADHASTMLDRELDDGIGENADHVLSEIGQALRRLDEGTYGTCAVCGREIPEERLTAVPYATLCLEDKRKLERG